MQRNEDKLTQVLERHFQKVLIADNAVADDELAKVMDNDSLDVIELVEV